MSRFGQYTASIRIWMNAPTSVNRQNSPNAPGSHHSPGGGEGSVYGTGGQARDLGVNASNASILGGLYVIVQVTNY